MKLSHMPDTREIFKSPEAFQTYVDGKIEERYKYCRGQKVTEYYQFKLKINDMKFTKALINT